MAKGGEFNRNTRTPEQIATFLQNANKKSTLQNGRRSPQKSSNNAKPPQKVTQQIANPLQNSPKNAKLPQNPSKSTNPSFNADVQSLVNYQMNRLNKPVNAKTAFTKADLHNYLDTLMPLISEYKTKQISFYKDEKDIKDIPNRIFLSEKEKELILQFSNLQDRAFGGPDYVNHQFDASCTDDLLEIHMLYNGLNPFKNITVTNFENLTVEDFKKYKFTDLQYDLINTLNNIHDAWTIARCIDLKENKNIWNFVVNSKVIDDYIEKPIDKSKIELDAENYETYLLPLLNRGDKPTVTINEKIYDIQKMKQIKIQIQYGEIDTYIRGDQVSMFLPFDILSPADKIKDLNVLAYMNQALKSSDTYKPYINTPNNGFKNISDKISNKIGIFIDGKLFPVSTNSYGGKKKSPSRYEKCTLKELKEKAKTRKLVNYSRLNKAALITALRTKK
jgi:hypothetical protein